MEIICERYFVFRQLRIFPAEEKQRAATIRSLRACLDEQHQDEHPLTSDPGDHARVDIGKVENALSKNTIASEDVGRDSSNSASDNGSSAVNTLTDDTLMHIFEMLPVQDRIRIERGNCINHTESYKQNLIL